MSAIKNFDEFIRKGIIRKQSTDKSRANFLVIESERDYSNLLDMIKKLKITENNANLFVKFCYDLLMEIIRAKMLMVGYNASGAGAHEAEVSYLRVLGFKETDVQFADQLRFFRNGILYYGTSIDIEYAEKVVEFTKRMYFPLKKMIK